MLAVVWLLSAAVPPPGLPIPPNRTGPVIAALLAIFVVGLGVIVAAASRITAAGRRFRRRRLSRSAAMPTKGRRHSR